MKINKVFNYILKYWKPFTLLVSVFGSLAMYISSYFLPNLKFNIEWIITFIYLGLISLVMILIEIRSLLVKENKDNYYSNMNNASNDIIKTIINASTKNKNAPVTVKIVGNRLSRISPILSDLLSNIKEKKVKRKLYITIYHIDPNVVDDLYFNKNKDREEIIKIQKITYDNLITNIKWLKAISKDISMVDINFVPYVKVPYFYCFLIDNTYLYWGYFLWNNSEKNWSGPSNTCFYFIRDKEQIKGFVKWIDNRMDIYDEMNPISEQSH